MRFGTALTIIATGLAHVVTAAAPIHAQQPGFPTDAEIRAILEERVREGRSRGIVVGLVDADGRVRYVAAGEAGADRMPLDAHSVFEIGSITKVFTGILLADMARRGEVSVDDPVVKYLPAGVTMPSRNGMEITLAQLSTQTSGLPRLPANMRPADLTNPYADYTPELMYAFLEAHTLRRDPGTLYEYSNLGVGLLGHVLAGHAGTSYEALVRDRILEPLGMEHTAIALTPWMQSHLVDGHNPGGDVVPLWDLPTLAGAGGLRSTAADMVLFLAANLRGEGPLAESLESATQPRAQAGSAAMRIGFGWHRLAADGDTIIWHNGGTGGFRTFAGFDRNTGKGVVVLTNSAGQGADDIGMHLLDRDFPLAPARSGAGGADAQATRTRSEPGKHAPVVGRGLRHARENRPVPAARSDPLSRRSPRYTPLPPRAWPRRSGPADIGTKSRARHGSPR